MDFTNIGMKLDNISASLDLIRNNLDNASGPDGTFINCVHHPEDITLIPDCTCPDPVHGHLSECPTNDVYIDSDGHHHPIPDHNPDFTEGIREKIGKAEYKVGYEVGFRDGRSEGYVAGMHAVEDSINKIFDQDMNKVPRPT